MDLLEPIVILHRTFGIIVLAVWIFGDSIVVLSNLQSATVWRVAGRPCSSPVLAFPIENFGMSYAMTNNCYVL